MTDEPHRCELDGCDEPIPRRPGERASCWRKRRFHSAECLRAWQRAAWRSERRECARPGCDVVFTPNRRDQTYHDHACSAIARSREPGAVRTDKRQEPKAAPPRKPVEPGAARAGKRQDPKVAPSRDRKPTEKPTERAVFRDAEETPPRRLGQVPERQPYRRTAPRPSFGLTRRRSA